MAFIFDVELDRTHQPFIAIRQCPGWHRLKHFQRTQEALLGEDNRAVEWLEFSKGIPDISAEKYPDGKGDGCNNCGRQRLEPPVPPMKAANAALSR